MELFANVTEKKSGSGKGLLIVAVALFVGGLLAYAYAQSSVRTQPTSTQQQNP